MKFGFYVEVDECYTTVDCMTLSKVKVTEGRKLRTKITYFSCWFACNQTTNGWLWYSKTKYINFIQTDFWNSSLFVVMWPLKLGRYEESTHNPVWACIFVDMIFIVRAWVILLVVKWQDEAPHDDLAVKLSNEILSNPSSFDVRTLVKVLCSLRLSTTNENTLKDLKILCRRMLKVCSSSELRECIDSMTDNSCRRFVLLSIHIHVYKFSN